MKINKNLSKLKKKKCWGNKYRNLPIRHASRWRYAIRTWSVGLTMPESVERFWIFIKLYMLDPNTTTSVPPTLFVTKGPLPCFNRSNPIITSFLSGVQNKRVIISAISANTIVNKSWIIFANFSPKDFTSFCRNDDWFCMMK